MSKRIVLFMHKGGVSKTTSVYNIGWMLAKKHRVLLVDADPQCNLSSLILGEAFEEYYTDNKTKHENIKDGVQPAFSGKPIPISAVECVSPPRAANIFLLAGHANLSEYDAALTFAQNSNNAITTLQNLPGAFNRLIELTEEKYAIDYTVIDLNPGLSSINQNLFLNSDSFILPTNPDPFSIMALDTLQTLLPKWADWKRFNNDVFLDSAYPLRNGYPKLVGSLIQRFNVRNGRAARPYRDNIEDICIKVGGDLYHALLQAELALIHDLYPQSLLDSSLCLGQISDFHGLLPKSQSAGVPVFDLTDQEIGETGPVLEGMIAKRDLFQAQFYKIGETIEAVLANV